jgi:hypothetical protein
LRSYKIYRTHHFGNTLEGEIIELRFNERLSVFGCRRKPEYGTQNISRKVEEGITGKIRADFEKKS